MIRRRNNHSVVTLLLQTEAGDVWPLRLSDDCTCFIGRYRRIENFGPSSGLLHFLPGYVA